MWVLRLVAILFALAMHFPVLQEQLDLAFDRGVVCFTADLSVREDSDDLRLLDDAGVAKFERLAVEVVIFSRLP